MRSNDVRWLVQSATSYPDILVGTAPAELLSAQESAKLASLHVKKRRRDWLLGRLTAKQLIQTVLADVEEALVRLNHIQIDNDPDGAPFAALLHNGLFERLPWSLSISHSNSAAYCAVHPTAVVGADMERIETREWNFVRSYFSPAEIALVERTPIEERDLLVTAIWSGKEAVLKVLREGLRLDTRTITCLFKNEQASTTAWMPYEIQAQKNSIASAGRWAGWWRLWQGEIPFVLTMATKD
jgi:4'-phosphopantetheinyl transferase